MARPLRIEFPNACYHVSNRGEDGKSIFSSDKLYQAFIEGLASAATRFNVEVHAFCVLRNEYHLLLKTPEGNLSRFMRQIDGLYTQHFQAIKKARGSVFKARYKAVLIQPEQYLLPVSRYIHHLPKQQRKDPATYGWSSLAAYLNKAKAEPWLERRAVLAALGAGSRPAVKYAAYVSEGPDAGLQHFYSRKNLRSVLGDDRFRKMAQGKTDPGKPRGIPKGAEAKKRPSIRQVVTAVAAHYKVSEKSIYQAARGPGSKNLPRWIAMYLCQELAGVTLQDIARRFGLKRYGTVSTTIGKLKQEFETNPKVLSAVASLSKKLSGKK